MSSNDSLTLTWTPHLDAASGVLRFEYRLENRGTQDVWALDTLLVFGRDAFAIDPEATIVREDPAHAGRVLLTRGFAKAVRSLPEIELRPVARRLAAGAALEGRGRTGWPLRNYNPNDGGWPLAHAAREALLEVGVLPGHHELEELPLEGGGVATVPRPADAYQFQHFIRATAFPLEGKPAK